MKKFAPLCERCAKPRAKWRPALAANAQLRRPPRLPNGFGEGENLKKRMFETTILLGSCGPGYFG